MATTTWSCIGHIVMYTMSYHVYEGHTDHHALVGMGLITCNISPNCSYILSIISEPHGSPKTNLTALKEKSLEKHLLRKLIQSVFERTEVKVH